MRIANELAHIGTSDPLECWTFSFALSLVMVLSIRILVAYVVADIIFSSLLASWALGFAVGGSISVQMRHV
jgi:hypothetical protein